VPPVTAGGAPLGTRAAHIPHAAPTAILAVPAVPAPHHSASRAGHTGRTAHPPVRQAPGGGLGGALDNTAAGDGGPSRHLDAHAVTPRHQVPVRLLAGAVTRTGVAEIRDRHRDIPVFPA
jgi:hypothetical protein